MLTKDDLLKRFAESESTILEDWIELLRFPSVSADPAHADDCRDCATWLSDLLSRMGFDATCIETSTSPLVFAQRQGESSGPVVMIYGHYDVQPTDPDDAWETPPFEPTMRDGRCYARGAEDNKGQLIYVLKALHSLIEQGIPLTTIKLVIEGGEENGSAGIAEVMKREPERFEADVLLVHDTSMPDPETMAVTMGLRGIIHLTATLTGADHDLHSGVHGGVAPNAAHGMAALLASLFDDQGGVAVEDFYDNVREATEEEHRLATSSGFDASVYKSDTGCLPVGGQHGIAAALRRGFLPSLDINGVHGGYGGPGMKTIIPSCATAKISARLVPDQDPEACLDAIEHHLEAHTQPGFSLQIVDREQAGRGFRLDPQSPFVRRARSVLQQLGDNPVQYRWEGASIPIVAELARISGAEPLLVGFGLEADRIHAPNESFSIAQLRLGFLYVGLVLQELSRHDGTS